MRKNVLALAKYTDAESICKKRYLSMLIFFATPCFSNIRITLGTRNSLFISDDMRFTLTLPKGTSPNFTLGFANASTGELQHLVVTVGIDAVGSIEAVDESFLLRPKFYISQIDYASEGGME